MALELHWLQDMQQAVVQMPKSVECQHLTAVPACKLAFLARLPNLYCTSAVVHITVQARGLVDATSLIKERPKVALAFLRPFRLSLS